MSPMTNDANVQAPQASIVITPPQHSIGIKPLSAPPILSSPAQSQFTRNASYIYHQERALNRRSPLLLRIRSAPDGGSYRFWHLETDWNCWRVSTIVAKLPVPGPCADRENSDAFTKREAAAEELYIRQEEKAKYAHLYTLDDATPRHTTHAYFGAHN